MADDTRKITTASPCPPDGNSFTDASSIARRTAIVDDIAPDGSIRVVVAGESGPRQALTLLQFKTAHDAATALLGQTVLVLCRSHAAPIITGKVADNVLAPQVPGEEGVGTLPPGTVDLRADKRRVDIEAADEIRLTCGKSSLTLRRDGVVVVRGVKITSRASQTNRIMGASVGIN